MLFILAIGLPAQKMFLLPPMPVCLSVRSGRNDTAQPKPSTRRTISV